MTESVLLIHLITDNKTVRIPYSTTTTAEDVCITLCKQLSVGPVSRHLFGLRITGKPIFLMPSSTFVDKQSSYDLRIRFKVANVASLKEVDRNAYDYYFHQARNDILENKIPDLVYEKHKRELVGLGVTDMYRVMLEKDIPRETVENEYRKYIPKEVIKHHSIFIKKPIRDSLGKIKKAGHDAWYVKMEYLKQLEMMVPEYLAEEYKAVTDQDGSVSNIYVRVSPYHVTEPGLKICYESKRERWQHICTIEELCYISARRDGTVEISRKNGIPFYLKFNAVNSMLSFVSLLDGYYRLSCKWIFNLCKDVYTPSLQKLYSMKCHGPIGGEFSYAKLEEKRGNRPGCFILRESETKYNIYYIDICMKDSLKPKTFKLEWLPGDEFIFNDDLKKYKTIHQLMAAYNDPQGYIYLQECLPPSEYDKSPLLLCRSNNLSGDFVADSSAVHEIIPLTPLCINSKDIQVYKSLEYQGAKAKTDSGVHCQFWKTSNPIHEVNNTITDEKFPEKSRKLAKNYCRNPNRDPNGPWCYTLDKQLIDESCGIPICVFTECQVTGVGIEYGGQHNRAISDRKCLKWNKVRNKIKQNGGYFKQQKFEKNKFPDKSLANSKNFCRNPDGDIGGPWCFVEIEDTDEIEREYCDIPDCDNQDCVVFSKNSSMYTHYTNFNPSSMNLTFGVRLWNSDSYVTASARLVLSVLPLPLTGKQINDVGIGLEIFISNHLSALISGNKDKPEFENSIGFLKSTEFTFFSLTWHGGFITLNKEGLHKPIFLAQYTRKDNLLGLMKDQFFYYAIQGTDILWSFPFCDINDNCDVHTTTSSIFQQFWPLRETNIGHDLQFHVRAVHSAYILFVPTPTVDYPCIQVMLNRNDNITRITSTEFKNAPNIVLKEVNLSPLMNYWKWTEFSITIFANHLQLYVNKETGVHMIIEIKHELIRKMRWFSPSSKDTVAHWTFYCLPPHFANPPNAWDPECALNDHEPNYNGTQGVTNDGLPCLPWSSKKLLPEDISELYTNKEAIKAVNYCRDPKNTLNGTYCYAITQYPELQVEKRFCKLRKCQSSECKIAGTGNDYIGKLFRTRSNRTCENWVTHLTKKHNNSNKSIYLNDSLYPDTSAEKAENFCRNPSKNIAGSWCYTSDLEIQDICNVKDCDMPEECTILVKGSGEGRDVYILPQWKEIGIYSGLHFSLKEWNPDLVDGIIFEIRPLAGNDIIKLVIGANKNEKILLFYQSQLVKEKTFPHLIPSGKWASFWLQIRKGEILLGYQSIPNALFEWKHENPLTVFEPIFIRYMSIDGNPMGIFFKCDDCHSEITFTEHFSKIMPISLWLQSENENYKNLTLHLRGNGTALIPLMVLPGSGDYYTVILGESGSKLFFINNRQEKVETLLTKQFNESLITKQSWTKFVILFNEHYLNITRNDSLIAYYHSLFPMLFYWFSIGAANGSLIWTANCDPPDIDGKPLDGGWSHWSSWECTVSCGGGEGYRTRTCSNPRPNLFGKACEGIATSTGICNNFECGDISPDTVDKVHDNLQTEQYSFIINEGDSILLENNNNVLEVIAFQSPDAYYEWSLNGLIITPEHQHIEYKGDNIFIEKADISDMGVYVCVLHRINKERLVLRVISLAIITEYDLISTRATLDVTLKTNAVVLGYIYSDLRQKWMLNNTVYIDSGITTLAAVSAEHLKPVNQSHSGIWKCVVEQPDLHLSWVTNLIRLKVKKAPNLYTNLMEDPLTAPLFSWLKTDQNVFIAIVFIVTMVCLIVATCLYVYLRWGTLPVQKSKQKYNRRRN